jgi:hypothetical protein
VSGQLTALDRVAWDGLFEEVTSEICNGKISRDRKVEQQKGV